MMGGVVCLLLIDTTTLIDARREEVEARSLEASHTPVSENNECIIIYLI